MLLHTNCMNVTRLIVTQIQYLADRLVVIKPNEKYFRKKKII